MNARLIAVLLAATLLGGCIGGMSDLESYAAEVRARKSSNIPPIPQIKPYEAFAYSAGERRDPFIPAAPESQRGAGGSSSALQPDLNRNREPLEEFTLDSLEMDGSIEYKGVTYALVKAPDKVVYRVRAGEHMGQNFGRITQIDSSTVKLTEIVADGFGGWVERPAVLGRAQ